MMSILIRLPDDTSEFVSSITMLFKDENTTDKLCCTKAMLTQHAIQCDPVSLGYLKSFCCEVVRVV